MDRRGILSKGDVTDVMDAIFNRSVPAPEAQQAHGTGLVGRHTGQRILPLAGERPGFLHDDRPIEAEDLREARPLGVAAQGGAGAQRPRLNPAMSTIHALSAGARLGHQVVILEQDGQVLDERGVVVLDRS